MSEPVTKLTAAKLSALLCARICHDLVSPVGALSAALEVLDDDGNVDMHDDAIELIKLSGRQASAKLQFLRLAFGAGGSAPGIIPTAELQKLANDVFDTEKTKLNWNLETDGLGKPAARTLLNLVMLSTQAIPRGGNVEITASQSGTAAKVEVVCNGSKARLNETITKTLAGGAPEDGFDGRSIQPFYTGMIAREAGGAVSASIDDETVTFISQIPV